MKQTFRWLFSLMALCFMLSSFAAEDGIYFGGQLGDSDLNYKTSDFQAGSVDNTGVGGRIYAGNQFSPYFAIEGGYTRYADVEFKDIFGVDGVSRSLDQYSVDLTLKGMLPLDWGFGVYGKVGAAYMQRKVNTEFQGFHASINSDDHQILPLFGAGVSYDITQQAKLDVSYTRVQNGGDFQNADLLALGFEYHIGQ